MPDVPKYNLPKPPALAETVIYCFPKGTSQADKRHDIVEIEKFIKYVKAKQRKKIMPKCYDCGDTCTKDYKFINIRSEDGNLMRIVIHNACHERALKGGPPVWPEGNITDV